MQDQNDRNQGEQNSSGTGMDEFISDRFSADAAGERGYRGRQPRHTPPGSVPGGSYGAGGGYQQGGYERGDWSGSSGEAWRQPGPHTGRGPRDYERSEAAIRDDVCERLTRHGHVDASGISVQVEQNEVVLEGEVDSRAAKRMAEDAAESVAGVRDVHNRLRITADVRAD